MTPQQELKLLSEIAHWVGVSHKQRQQEITQWKDANPDLARSCRIASEALSVAKTSENTEVNVGDFVEVETLGGRVGKVVEIRNEEAVVAVGVMKLAVPRVSLRVSSAESAAPEVAVAIRGDLPEVQAPSEIDLRGMRVGEVEDIVMHAVDAAVRADLKTLRIIHGKGTGALRDRVAEMLRKETRVTSFRLGAWNEGGAGVTVVELG